MVSCYSNLLFRLVGWVLADYSCFVYRPFEKAVSVPLSLRNELISKYRHVNKILANHHHDTNDCRHNDGVML